MSSPGNKMRTIVSIMAHRTTECCICKRSASPPSEHITELKKKREKNMMNWVMLFLLFLLFFVSGYRYSSLCHMCVWCRLLNIKSVFLCFQCLGSEVCVVCAQAAAHEASDEDAFPSFHRTVMLRLALENHMPWAWRLREGHNHWVQSKLTQLY